MTRILFFILLIVRISLSGTKEERVLQELIERQRVILQAAQSVRLSPRIVAGVIYAERLRNFNWDDAILDDVLAKSGYNSSTGFAQIKVNTAFWIEEELHNPARKYFLGKEIQLLFPRSRSREEIIQRLTNDTANINYCAVYIAMIHKRWSDAGHFFSQTNEAGLLATLYSLGIVKANGEERLPHPNSSMNEFGKTAQRFFDEFLLRNEFP